MLDRAVGEYIPYFFQEKPELEKQFSGFTYYANTISFGAHTNFGAPALFGGYEYTPVEMNRRDGELLVDKHNEALKVMPVLFGQNGYRVTVCDPPYAGYEEIPDLSIYDDYPDIKSYILKGKFAEDFDGKLDIAAKKRNFFCFSMLKIVPLCLQKTVYDYGNYNQAYIADTIETKQVMRGEYYAFGMDPGFMDSYNMLGALPSMTKITAEEKDTFLMMSNELTHSPILLQEPEYVPAVEVDNTEYMDYQERYTFNGRTLRMQDAIQITTYQINMAALLQLGKWFDYMREEDVFDNTRIILVSDHGRSELFESDENRLGEGDDISRYYPLLMVKDFGSEEITVSEEFMTNGDVPVLAFKGIIEEPVNPFTGKAIDSSEKMLHEQYVAASNGRIAKKNNGYTYLPSRWYSVHDDMREADNWKLLSEEETVLPAVGNEN